MESLGAYIRVSEVQETNNAFLFDVRAPDASVHFAKVPKNLEAGSSAARQFSNVARNLKKISSPYINKVINSGSNERGIYYIVLEKIEDSKTLEDFVRDETHASLSFLKKTLQIWLKCAEALDIASSKNIFHKDLHPRNILITKDGEPMIIDFGIATLEHTISKKPAQNEFSNKFSAPELILKNEDKIQARTDFYSLSLCILYTLLGHKLFYEKENNDLRLERVISSYDQFLSKELQNEFETVFRKSFDSSSGNRYFRYTELRDALSHLFDHLNDTPEKPFAINFWTENSGDIESFLNEANQDGLRLNVEEKRHYKSNSITARIATSSYYIHTSFPSDKGNCLEVQNLKSLKNLEGNELNNHAWVLKNGKEVKGVGFTSIHPRETTPDGFYDIHGLLDKLYLDKNEVNKSRLDKSPKIVLNDYLALLDEEVKHLRADAFKVRYTDFKSVSTSEAVFSIQLDEETNIEDVDAFLSRSKGAFTRGNELTILASEKSDGVEAENVGFSIDFDRATNQFFIRDFPEKRKDEIPMKGFLIEDTSVLEVQYKRQINAIKNYIHDNVANSELRKYLFQPKRLQKLADESGQINTPLEIISRDKNGEPVNFQDAQREAILKSLYRPPITIIQGPPGTGKTTVITEIIRQILAKDEQAKILLTSQTNLAVDNVLGRMMEVPGLSFIRLGRIIDDQGLDEHSFDKKLSLWARKTKSQSDKNFSDYKKQIDAGSKNQPPLVNQIAKELNKKQEWSVTKRELKTLLTGLFAKGYEGLYGLLENKMAFEEEFSKYMGEEQRQFNKREGLHRKWKSILSNIENHDALKAKFIAGINVVGATANHIAAGKYRDFNFEFDYVIMDEAAKATPAETLVPINMGHNLILVGDHLQLPPIVTATDSVKKKVMERIDTEGEMIDFDKVYSDKPSLFEIMHDASPEEFKEMLDLQFRMPKQIGDIISKLVYKNKLRSNEHSGKAHQLKLKTSTSMFMCDTMKFPNRFHEKEKIGKSSFNRQNAKIIVETLTRLDAYDQLFSDQENPYSIGVITGYGKQAEYITNEIGNFDFKNLVLGKNLTVATVDSFQGSEKDIIIYDIVRSGKASEVDLGFLEMPNRINVAFTRSTRLLIVVGDSDFVMNVKPSQRWTKHNPGKPLLLKEFVAHLHESGLVYDHLNDIFYDESA